MDCQIQGFTLLLRHNQGQGQGQPERNASSEADAGEGGASLRCVQCRHKITWRGAGMELQGSHRHVFFNPHGQVFELGLFSSAKGCVAIGPGSEEFTWFPGYAWQVALCGRCGLHLGWLYRGVSRPGNFWGLILPNLVEEQDED